jgi:hypothetical protein
MKVGNRIVLISETLYVPDGETAEIEYQIATGDFLKIRLLFPQEVEHEGNKNPVIKYVVVGDWFEMYFANFKSPLGATTDSPTIFATSNAGESISYVAGVYKLKNFTKIELQVMMEVRS